MRTAECRPYEMDGGSAVGTARSRPHDDRKSTDIVIVMKPRSGGY